MSDGIPLQYQPTKYAQRSRSVYVASAYTDQTHQVEVDEHAQTCWCGGTDALHEIDAVEGVVHQRRAQTYKGYTNLSAELNLLSCHTHKNIIVSPPPPDEVDSICALRSAPPCSWNLRGGQNLQIRFDEWLADKHERAVEEEARKKRQAVAELTLQIARRAQASREYEEWRKEKAELRRREIQREQEERARKQPPSAEELQQRQRERDESFQEWCASKDRARLSKKEQFRNLRDERTIQEQQLKQSQDRKAEEAFQIWKADREAKLLASRATASQAKRDKRLEEKQTKEQRAEKAKELYAEWKKETEESLKKEKVAQGKKKHEDRMEKEKREKEVAASRADQENRHNAHFHAVIVERERAAAREARAKKAEHKLIWRKKEHPVAYGTLPRPQKTFR